MGKLYVSVVCNTRKTKLCKDDIKQVYSHKPKKAPKIPIYLSTPTKCQEEDRLTTCEEF